MKGLFSLRKEKKERVHNFTQRFVDYMKNFYVAIKPTKNTLIEYYTSALGPNPAIFVKISVKPTLEETYEEAKKVDAEMESIE